MKTISSILPKFSIYSLSGFLAVFMASCGSYQNTSYDKMVFMALQENRNKPLLHRAMVIKNILVHCKMTTNNPTRFLPM